MSPKRGIRFYDKTSPQFPQGTEKRDLYFRGCFDGTPRCFATFHRVSEGNFFSTAFRILCLCAMLFVGKASEFPRGLNVSERIAENSCKLLASCSGKCHL